MRFNISFAEVKSIAEFLRFYKEGFIAKANVNDKGISLKFRKSGLESYYLHFYPPDILFLSNKNRLEGTKSIDQLNDFKIKEILDPGTDRWILIEGFGEKISIELMGGGNFIVTDGENIIFKFKDVKRKNKTTEKYTYPEIMDFVSPLFDWKSEIQKSTADPVRTLASRIGLSKYAEEIICKLGKNIKNNEDLIENLDEIRSFGNYIIEKAKEMKIYDYEYKYLVLESACSEKKVEPRPIQIALEEIYDRLLFKDRDKTAAIKRDIDRLKKEEEKLREYGDLIIRNLQSIQEALENARNGILKQKIDFEKRKMILNIEGKEIELDIDKTAGENANIFYEASKKIRKKLENLNIDNFKVPERRKEKKILQRIFQNYRWFITSEGNLVLAGKDAESNDSVVKKYLDEKDIYLHADIHGAPSVILKNINGITEKSINEAAQFAWCMSRAWSAGFGNGSVFYVTKSQVSKTPESGEYVPRGAWIIRGKKNYITHLELKLGIGFQKYQNRDYLVSAPISALTEPYVSIIPGEEENLIDRISEFLNVDKELIYPILPPGKSKIENFFKKSASNNS